MEKNTKGIVLMILSAFFFALMAAMVKYLENIPVAQKIFFRNILGFFVAYYMLRKNNESLLGNNRLFLFLRSFFGLLGVAAYFIALSILPLANAVILNMMSPFFVLILSAIFLGEKIRKVHIISLGLAILGAAFVIKPELNISILPSIVALLSAFFAAAAYTTVSYLASTDSSETIVFYFTFFSTVTMIPFMVYGGFEIPTTYELIGLIALGIFATAAQFLMTYAYRYAPAGELSLYNYTNIVFSIIIGLVFWSEIPDTLSILGAIFITLAGIINLKGRKTVN